MKLEVNQLLSDLSGLPDVRLTHISIGTTLSFPGNLLSLETAGLDGPASWCLGFRLQPVGYGEAESICRVQAVHRGAEVGAGPAERLGEQMAGRTAAGD